MKSSISSLLSISGSTAAALLTLLLLQTPTIINAQQSNIDTFDDISNLNTTNSTQEAIDTLLSIGLITTPSPPSDDYTNDNNNDNTDLIYQGGISSTIQTDIQTSINEQLVSNILTLDEFNEVRLTESPADFGQLEDDGEYSEYDFEKLWRDAAIFEYEVSFVSRGL